MESVHAIKQRFGIIGDDPKLNRAIEKAIQVAPTDISVLVTGESGVGKESIPRIIHLATKKAPLPAHPLHVVVILRRQMVAPYFSMR